MKVAYKTDIGKRRRHNEDDILVDEDMNIFLIADGLGGHQAGEVASDLAVKKIEWIIRQHEDDPDLGAGYLITETNNKGGINNISVIIVKYE
jgi:serine/threonine protein phosphatase PrpC